MGTKSQPRGIVIYQNLEGQDPIKLRGVKWSRTSKIHFSINHQIAYYLAMFAPTLPYYFIMKYTKPGDVVMDNFSGRGTTGLVCREFNRSFIGTDLNPYAYVLTKYKISCFQKQDLLNLVEQWAQEYQDQKPFYDQQVNDYQELLAYYHPDTLSQLLFVRDKYGSQWQKLSIEQNAILAIMLGLMHGPCRKDHTSQYFSVSTSNTVSMSLNYVQKYCRQHQLIAYYQPVFENTKAKIQRVYELMFKVPFDGTIHYHDATMIDDQIKDNSVDFVITSPPYLSIVNYVISNWLKLWLLGYDRTRASQEIHLSDKLKIDEYVDFIEKYLNAIYPKLKDYAKVCLVVGDVQDEKLIEDVWTRIATKVKYRFVEIYYDYNYKQTRKATNALNSKKGKGTIIEKVLVIEKLPSETDS